MGSPLAVLAASILLLATGVPANAQAPGRWQYLRSESFESPAWNAPGSPLKNPACPGEVIKAEVAGHGATFEHSVPGACNHNRPHRTVHAHGWSRMADALAPGQAPDVSTFSAIRSLSGPVQPYDATAVAAGFVAFDAAPGQAPDPKLTLAKSSVENRQGVDYLATDSHLKRTRPFRMPQAPWERSERNGGMVRFRVHLTSGKVWRSVDRVYQWTTRPAVSTESTSGWRFLRSETLESTAFDAPDSPWRNAACPGEIVKAEASPLAVVYEHTLPAPCNNGVPFKAVHAHGWSKLVDFLPAGSAPAFSLQSTIKTLSGSSAPGDTTSVTAGFVAFDATGDLAPEPPETLAQSGLSNRQGAGILSTDSHLKHAQPLNLPEAPWKGSDRHNGMVRFRIHFRSGTIWKSFDRVYQWDGR